MKFSPDDKTSHAVVPPNLRCVWMSAGILSYQLCGRQFECDDCPLDAAMRMHFSQPDLHANGDRPPHDGALPELFYSRNHCWLSAMAGDVARIGIEPGLASALRSPKAIVLPSVGEKLKQHDWCAWIVLDGGTVPLRAPLSGVVRTVNTILTNEPNQIFRSPLNEGWLFDVEVKNDEFIRSHLMKRKEAEKKFDLDRRLFLELIAEAFHLGSKNVGMTLQDGGQRLSDAPAMLGGKRYAEIVREAFGGAR